MAGRQSRISRADQQYEEERFRSRSRSVHRNSRNSAANIYRNDEPVQPLRTSRSPSFHRKIKKNAKPQAVEERFNSIPASDGRQDYAEEYEEERIPPYGSLEYCDLPYSPRPNQEEDVFPRSPQNYPSPTYDPEEPERDLTSPRGYRSPSREHTPLGSPTYSRTNSPAPEERPDSPYLVPPPEDYGIVPQERSRSTSPVGGDEKEFYHGNLDQFHPESPEHPPQVPHPLQDNGILYTREGYAMYPTYVYPTRSSSPQLWHDYNAPSGHYAVSPTVPKDGPNSSNTPPSMARQLDYGEIPQNYRRPTTDNSKPQRDISPYRETMRRRRKEARGRSHMYDEMSQEIDGTRILEAKFTSNDPQYQLSEPTERSENAIDAIAQHSSNKHQNNGNDNNVQQIQHDDFFFSEVPVSLETVNTRLSNYDDRIEQLGDLQFKSKATEETLRHYESMKKVLTLYKESMYGNDRSTSKSSSRLSSSKPSSSKPSSSKPYSSKPSSSKRSSPRQSSSSKASRSSQEDHQSSSSKSSSSRHRRY